LNLRYVENIESQYRISYKQQDILGVGAFGIVRVCKKRSNAFGNNQKENRQYPYAIKIIEK
jgi:hypothetical protein